MHSFNNTTKTRGYLTSRVKLTILMNLSQACCLRPHSYISLWIKSRSRLSKMAADKKSFFDMKAFGRLQNSARISHKKWPQRKGTSVRLQVKLESSSNRQTENLI